MGAGKGGGGKRSGGDEITLQVQIFHVVLNVKIGAFLFAVPHAVSLCFLNN